VARFLSGRAGKKAKFSYTPVSSTFQPARDFQPVTITYQLDPASKAALQAKATPKRARKTDTHTAAFVVGFVATGLASAAAVLWKIPRAGTETRELIADRTEATLFNLMGMDGYLTGEKIPTAVAAAETAWAASIATASHDDDTEPFVPLENDGGSLPPTFRGQILTETPEDVVVDTQPGGSIHRPH